MTPEGKFEIDDVVSSGSGSLVVVIDVDETAAGVQVLRVQRTDRQTIIAPEVSKLVIEWTGRFDAESRDAIRDGKPGW